MWTTCKRIKLWIRVAAAITLLCFISYDIAWAYPADGHSSPTKLSPESFANSPEKVKNFVKFTVSYINAGMESFQGLPVPDLDEKVDDILDQLETAFDALKERAKTDPEIAGVTIDEIVKSKVDRPGQLRVVAGGGDVVFKIFFALKGEPWPLPEEGYKELAQHPLGETIRCQILGRESCDYLDDLEIEEAIPPAKKEDQPKDKPGKATKGIIEKLGAALPVPLAESAPETQTLMTWIAAGLVIAAILVFSVWYLWKRKNQIRSYRTRGIRKKLIDRDMGDNEFFTNPAMDALAERFLQIAGTEDFNATEKRLTRPYYDNFELRLANVCRQIKEGRWDFSRIPVLKLHQIDIGNGLTFAQAFVGFDHESIVGIFEFLSDKIYAVTPKNLDPERIGEVYQMLTAIGDFTGEEAEPASPASPVGGQTVAMLARAPVVPMPPARPRTPVPASLPAVSPPPAPAPAPMPAASQESIPTPKVTPAVAPAPAPAPELTPDEKSKIVEIVEVIFSNETMSGKDNEGKPKLFDRKTVGDKMGVDVGLVMIFSSMSRLIIPKRWPPPGC